MSLGYFRNVYENCSTVNSLINSFVFCGFFYFNSLLLIFNNSNISLYTTIPKTPYCVLSYLTIIFIPSIFIITLTDIKNRKLKKCYHYEWWERSFNIDFYSVLLSFFSSMLYSFIFIKTELYVSILCIIFEYNIFRIWWYQCDPVAVMIIGGRPFFEYIMF